MEVHQWNINVNSWLQFLTVNLIDLNVISSEAVTSRLLKNEYKWNSYQKKTNATCLRN